MVKKSKETDIVVAKIGSRVLSKGDDIDMKVIEQVTDDISHLVQNNVANVVLVSSGSVLIGKHRLAQTPNVPKMTGALLKQVSSTIGQVDLVHSYEEEFRRRGIDTAQGLVTRRDFSLRDRYNSMRDVIRSLLHMKKVPILNENDLLSDEELEFSDNDQLAAYVSAMVNASRLVILSDVDGLLDAPPRMGGKIVPKVEDIAEARKLIWGKRKKEISAGGMESKLNTAELMMDLGIPMHLVNGKKTGVLRSVVEGNQEGTLFEAVHEESDFSDIERWLKTGAVARGRIVVSTYIADLLRQGRHPNVLSIGVEDVQESFQEDDVVEVLDESGTLLGKGVARIGSQDFTLNKDDEIEGKQKSEVVIRAAKFASLRGKRK